MKKSLALSLSDVVFIMQINVKMPTIVGILTFMSRINFVKKFYKLGAWMSCRCYHENATAKLETTQSTAKQNNYLTLILHKQWDQ